MTGLQWIIKFEYEYLSGPLSRGDAGVLRCWSLRFVYSRECLTKKNSDAGRDGCEIRCGVSQATGQRPLHAFDITAIGLDY